MTVSKREQDAAGMTRWKARFDAVVAGQPDDPLVILAAAYDWLRVQAKYIRLHPNPAYPDWPGDRLWDVAMAVSAAAEEMRKQAMEDLGL